MDQIDREKREPWALRQAIATSRLEGLYLTDAEIEQIKRCSRGEITVEELLAFAMGDET